MLFGSADLFFDQIEIVEQPFCCRGDLPVILDGSRQQIAGLGDDDVVFSEPRQQLVACAPGTELVRAGQRLAVLLHLYRTEEFRA